MLAIRMQRNGRKGHAMFRMIVQDARRTPTSGRVIAYIGSYDPHAKKVILDKEKASFYLEHGAKPSEPVVRLLKAEKVNLPQWVGELSSKQGKIKNPDKRRSTTPKAEEPKLTEQVNEKQSEANSEVIDNSTQDSKEADDAIISKDA